MYAFLDHPIEGEYCCAKCKHIVSLEAQVLNLGKQLSALRSPSILKVSQERTRQVPAGASTEAGGDKEVQALAKSRWVTVRRGRGGSAREADPGLEHPNKYAPLSDIGETSQGPALLELRDSPSCQGKNSSSESGGAAKGKERQILVVGDSILRRTERAICNQDLKRRTVCCLPGARVRHITDLVDRLLGGAGEDPAVMVHVGTNDKVRGRWSVLKNDFRDLGAKLRKRTSKVVFSGILPVHRATPERQREIREVNKWLKSWCSKEGFGFLEDWADFSVGNRYYRRDGLHLNEEGADLLGMKMAKKLEGFLN